MRIKPNSAQTKSDMEDGLTFRHALIEHGLLISMGAEGLCGFSNRFENVVSAVDALLTRSAANDKAEIMRFPPALSRTNFEKSDYMKSFPNLAGTVHSFSGGTADHARLVHQLQNGGDWTEGQRATDVVLAPAACYAVYPVVSCRGSIPESGCLVDVASYCFRHEPSSDPTRLQLFRMREYVRIGSPEQVLTFRDQWMERGRDIVRALQLPFSVDIASDPFFGRSAQIMRESQREQALKFELSIPISSLGGTGTACLSFNYHRDHFGHLWNLVAPNQSVAHTGCVGFGLERLALALFRHHGFDPPSWPGAVRQYLLI